MVRVHQGTAQVALAFLPSMLALNLGSLDIEVHFAAVVSFVVWSLGSRLVVDAAHGAQCGVHWHLKQMNLERHV